MTLGSPGNSSVYINDSGTWREFINYEYFKVVRKQNQVSEFEIKIMDLEDAEKVYVKEFAEIIFLSEVDNKILKGRIQKIDYETSYESIATGFGMEVLLLDKLLTVINFLLKEDGDKLLTEGGDNILLIKDSRMIYNNVSAKEIVEEINSDILTTSGSGIFSSDYGDMSIRFEYNNRLNALGKVAKAIDYEWGVSQTGVDFADDILNFDNLLPNSTRATVSQETFAIDGANANCYLTSNKKDITNLANKIDILGYGDGTNQKHTSTYNASETYSTLASDITDSSTTITLSDASSFSASGEIRIAEERVTYSGKSGNDLTGCVRGSNNTIALAHRQNVYTEKYIDFDSPEAGSSIGTNGILDYTITKRDIIEIETLELIASRILLERKDPIIRIIIIPNEPLETAGSREIGDLITITDAESAISDDYRIVGMTYISDYGNLSLEIEASNGSLNFVEQMQKQKEQNENISRYMQGATNIYTIHESANCDVSNPLNIFFYMPSKAIAINKVFLSFKLRNYRYSESGGITEEELTEPSITIQVGEEDSETTIGTFTSDQEETDITSFVSSSRDWTNIKITPNKRMRIDANVSVQMFLESK